MLSTDRPRSLARAWFLAVAVAGLAWWVAVIASDDVRRWTLGTWDPGVLVGPDLALFVGAALAAAVTGRRVWAVVTTVWTVGATVALVGYGLAERAAGWGIVAMTLASLGSIVAAAVCLYGHVPLRWFFVGPFRFRPARHRSPGSHVRRSLVQLVIFWSTFLIGLPLLLAWGEQRLRLDWPPMHHACVAPTGVALFVLGSAFGLWSCLSMARHGDGTPLPAETASKLVVAGPYRIVRNPMAVAGVVQTSGVGLWRGSWTVIAAGLAGAVVWHWCIRPTEEADLHARFGVDYERYRASVSCWIPRQPRKPARSAA